MVYYDPQDLGWRPFVKSWMQTVGGKFKQETQVYLMDHLPFKKHLKNEDHIFIFIPTNTLSDLV